MVNKVSGVPGVRRRDANLGRILDAAMTLIAKEGLSALSMARLAEAADYTPGALYRYFESKDALLSRLVVRTLDELGASQARALSLLPSQASPLARVVLLAQGYRAFAAGAPHAFGLLATTLSEPRVLLSRDEEAGPVARAMIAALSPLSVSLAAAAAAEALEPGDASERTLCLFALLQGLLSLQKSARYAPEVLDVDRLTARGVRSLLLGWGGKPRTVDAAFARVAALGELGARLGGES